MEAPRRIIAPRPPSAACAPGDVGAATRQYKTPEDGRLKDDVSRLWSFAKYLYGSTCNNIRKAQMTSAVDHGNGWEIKALIRRIWCSHNSGYEE
jgi:hypothetical protein